MGIVFGYLSLICFCMLVAKWIARRCNLIKFDNVLMRIHRPVSLLLIVFCILHISFCIPVLRNRNILVNVSGVVAVVFMIVLIFSCHVLKQKDRRMKWHRILTILMAVCIVWHVVVYFMDFREYQRNVDSIVFENIESLYFTLFFFLLFAISNSRFRESKTIVLDSLIYVALTL